MRHRRRRHRSSPRHIVVAHPNPAHTSLIRPNSDMASCTLPLGGGLPEVSCIATSRSNVTDTSQIAEELRDVVRGELRKLIEVGG